MTHSKPLTGHLAATLKPASTLAIGLVAALAACQGTSPNADPAAEHHLVRQALSQTSQGPIHPQKDNGKCLDVRIGSHDNGAPVQIATCYGDEAQNWQFTGSQLRVYGNKCLDVTAGRGQNGTKLQIWDCADSNPNQKWARKGNTFVWNNRFCMDLTAGDTQDLTLVQIWECGQNNVNQQWRPEGGQAQPAQAVAVNTQPETQNSQAQASAAQTSQPAKPAPAPVAAAPEQNGHAAYSSNNPGASSATQDRPKNSLSVLDYGVRNDGNGDYTQAIQSAFDAAKAQNKAVYFPAGTYNHSGVLKADGIQVYGAGVATIVRATNPTNSALVLTGAQAMLNNLTTQVAANSRSSQPYDCGVLIIGAHNAQVLYVDVQGASANGFRIDSSDGCTITKSIVNGSNADGVALVNGATNNTVSFTQVSNASDDSFSSDSYPSERQNSGNTFSHCYAGPNYKQGRSFALMGSSDETIKNCVSAGSLWHGIIAGTDPSSTTQNGFGFTIQDNLVTGNASGLPVMITSDGGMSQAGNADGLAHVSGTRTSGDAASVLGWAPVVGLPSPSSFNNYTGGGPGSSNTPGNRS